MHCRILIVAIMLFASEWSHCADPLTSNDIWRIQRGWGARDAAEKERWAAAGYDANGKRIADAYEDGSSSSKTRGNSTSADNWRLQRGWGASPVDPLTPRILEQQSRIAQPSTRGASLGKSLRGQMEQAVWLAGLVSHRYDARKLTDEELINLHRQAQPTLELKKAEREAKSARAEADRARQEAANARQEAERAKQEAARAAAEARRASHGW